HQHAARGRALHRPAAPSDPGTDGGRAQGVSQPALDVMVAPAPQPSPVGPCRFHFPDPREADADGLLATGGDLEPATLLAAYRPAADETWITPAIRDAYARLHRLGWAHSVEVWVGGALAGGLYGVSIGALFAAESMFHRVTDASKVALVALAQHARAVGVQLVDVQMPTPHLQSMGAVTISRDEYLAALALAVTRPVKFTGGRS